MTIFLQLLHTPQDGDRSPGIVALARTPPPAEIKSNQGNTCKLNLHTGSILSEKAGLNQRPKCLRKPADRSNTGSQRFPVKLPSYKSSAGGKTPLPNNESGTGSQTPVMLPREVVAKIWSFAAPPSPPPSPPPGLISRESDSDVPDEFGWRRSHFAPNMQERKLCKGGCGFAAAAHVGFEGFCCGKCWEHSVGMRGRTKKHCNRCWREWFEDVPFDGILRLRK